MLRSVRIAAVVVGLAWTGLAGAQSSSPLEKARYINVSEEGKPPQRCKLIKSWREANGVPAFQVQAVDSGEIMTIVATAPRGGAGDPREITTRIFRWGKDNKPPAGAPVPPATTTAGMTPPTQPAVEQKPQTTSPQMIQPSPVAAIPPSTQIPPIVQKPVSTPAPVPTKPAFEVHYLSSSKSDAPTIDAKAKPVTPSKPQLTPMGTQVIQYSSTSPKADQLPTVPNTTDSQPRLSPMASGSSGNSNPSNCACSQPCNPCGQSSCVTCAPSPTRQPLLSRLRKSNTACPCATVVSQPPATLQEKPVVTSQPNSTVAKTITEPAKPGDWRKSWGGVESSEESAPATTVKPIDVSKRMDPMPVRMDPSPQPDPLKAPDQYRDMVMNARLANSKVPQQPQPTVMVEPKKGLLRGWAIGKPPTPQVEQSKQLNGTIVISADEPNAFWAPEKSGAGQAKAKFNAFNRQPETPPQAVPPTIPGVPPSVPRPLPDIPGVAINMLPPRPPTMNMPIPPLPATAQQRGPMVMMPDSGVPAAMGNAFTLTATSRPIPADFGSTPQEPNGFEPPSRQGQGTPPQAYGMAMPGMNRPQMPNGMAMGQQAPMAVNPLMNVPAMPANGQYAAAADPSAPAGSVPQLLATLKNALGPSEREAAAEQLSELDWHIQPMVVESLMKSAWVDPAATVRAACIHALAHMKVDTPAALALMRDLKYDRDPNVRHEAEAALSTFGDPSIQQASHK
jgi:hypothetical protein